MTDKSSPKSGKKPRVERLELNKETIEELTESETEAAEGGRIQIVPTGPSGCGDRCPSNPQHVCGSEAVCTPSAACTRPPGCVNR